MTKTAARLVVLAACAITAIGATEPNDATRRWWSHVKALSGDAMQGRDTGSEGHRKAAEYVVSRFTRAGLAPAGERGFYQPVPLHGVSLAVERSSVELVRPNGEIKRLQWLRQISTAARVAPPATFDALLGFTGWETPSDLVGGRVLVALAPPRLTPGPRGYAQTPPPGFAGTLVIESPAGPEPLRWPLSSSQAMTLKDEDLPSRIAGGSIGFQFNPADAESLFEGSGHTYAELRALADRGERLPSFPMATRLRGRIESETRDLSSDNVVALLRGSDPVLADELVVISAHLDGYGLAEPVNGDRIYNGTLDDAAYVATLIDLAEQLRETGRRFKRSVLFCVFTGEERGLLGSRYFVAHPTVPMQRIVANINLDTLRPIFPLRSLTTLALDETTLGDAARQVGESMNIRIKADSEPDRQLLRRSDQWNFLQAGIPALAFVFGFEPGSADEAIYRRWYVERYHSPADDLDQPWNPDTAARFNDFFARLLATVADAPDRPAWKPGNTFKR
jgi:Zn-dependent M28 family amino/carboxypeptidase